jgi:SRSO17 transposase
MAREDLARLDRLQTYLREMTEGMGRRERLEALTDYLRGLMLDGERKSLQPMAARLVTDDGDAEACRQRMQQAVVVASWDERELYRRLCAKVVEGIEDLDALVIDDTGFVKKGRYSPGVQRQYSGTLGRTDNCQVAVSLHLASPTAGACIGMRLFLPEAWDDDEERRRRAKIPSDVRHREKWRLALELLDERREWGLPDVCVLADSGYGDARGFRGGLRQRGFTYVVGVNGKTSVWAHGRLPLSPEQRRARQRGKKRGHPISAWARDLKPQQMKDVVAELPDDAWSEYEWTNGDGRTRSGVFTAMRIRTAHRACAGTPPGDPQWMLVQPSECEEKHKYWLSTLPEDEDPGRLIYLAKLRWRIERDYQEMKGELGLDHFEGRTWSGFHHHCALVAAAHAFIALERALFPPGPTHAAEVPAAAAGRHPD